MDIDPLNYIVNSGMEHMSEKFHKAFVQFVLLAWLVLGKPDWSSEL